MQFKTVLAGLVCAATLAIPAAASATVFQDNGTRDASAFTNVGPVLSEGTGGAGKYVWFVDRLAGEDILRGFDQDDPLATTQLATVNGNVDVGEGPIGSVSGLAFNPTQNLLYVADEENDRIIVYPRANDGTANDPVNYMTAFSAYSFNSGFNVTDPKGIAIDASETYYGYASVKNSDGRRGVLVFNPTPSGNSLVWQKFVWDPSEWNTTEGPGAMAVNPVNGNLYVAIDGLGRVRGYTPFIDDVAGTFNSATPGDYNSLAVDHSGNRLLAAKTDGIDVFSLRTSRLLGTAADTAFSQTTGLASLQSGGKYFLASSGATHLQDLVVNAVPTCTPYAPLDAVAGSVLTFTPSCTDADESTTLEFEILGETNIGTANTSNNDSTIDYYGFEGELGPDAVDYRVTTQNGRSTTYSQPINVVEPDTTAPVISITAPIDAATVTSSPTTLNFSVNDNRDPSPICNYASGQQLPLNVGANTITVSCTDASGNTGQDAVAITYDAAPPAVGIITPNDSAIVTGSSVVLNYVVNDDTDSAPICSQVNGGAVGLSVGSNTIVVTCTDSAGRTGSDSVTVTYDDEAPLVEITAPTNGEVITTDMTALSYTVSDDTDSSPNCSWISGDSVGLTVGSNTLTVSCSDHAGRAASQSVTVTYDAEAPVVEIASPVDGDIVTSPELYVEYSANDDTDNGLACDAPSEEPYLLGAGVNTIVVTCTDDAGRTGSDSVTVIYDADAPEVTISAPVNGSTTQTNQTVLRYTATDDADEELECTREDGATIGLVEGTNTIAVTCTDDAGRSTTASSAVTYSPPVQAAASSEPFIRKTANLEPTTGEVLVKLPGSDKYIPLSEALLAPVGTIVDARKGTAKLTLANADGSTYEASFWGGIFQIFQGTGDNPVAIMKLRDDLIDEGVGSTRNSMRASSNPFRAIQIAARGKKKNGLWGKGKGKFKTSGSGGSATVRGTTWYVANYEGGTLFTVKSGVVNVRPTHGNCFDLKAGQSRFVEYKPLTESQKKKKLSKKKSKPKKGCL